jgi:hypothetical protein
MDFIKYFIADVAGIVVGLAIYDWMCSVRWIKFAKRQWKHMSKLILTMFKRKTTHKPKVKQEGSDVY